MLSEQKSPPPPHPPPTVTPVLTLCRARCNRKEVVNAVTGIQHHTSMFQTSLGDDVMPPVLTVKQKRAVQCISINGQLICVSDVNY